MPIEVTKARDMSPLSGSLTVIAGPPGLGKSWFSGTMAEYLDADEVLVIATLPREVNSLQYQKHNLDTIVVTDEDWRPEAGVLKATGHRQLIDVLRDLRADEKYAGIIIDNGTEMAELAWHAAMEPLGVGDPNDLGRGSNRFAPYTSLREKMENAVRSLSILTGKTGLVKRPKLVAIPWHVQPPKETSDDDDSADQKGQGSEYEGEYLPMIRGSFRRRIMGLVDNYIYADLVRVQGSNPLSKVANHFAIQVVSDKERHVKLEGIAPDPKDLLDGKYIDVHGRNDAWRAFMDLLNQED